MGVSRQLSVGGFSAVVCAASLLSSSSTALASEARLQALDPEFTLVSDDGDGRYFPSVWAAHGGGVWAEAAHVGVSMGRRDAWSLGVHRTWEQQQAVFGAVRVADSLHVGVSGGLRLVESVSFRMWWPPQFGREFTSKVGIAWNAGPSFRTETSAWLGQYVYDGWTELIHARAGVPVDGKETRRPSFGLRQRVTIGALESTALVLTGWYDANDRSETMFPGTITAVPVSNISERKGLAAAVRFVPREGATAWIGAAFDRTRTDTGNDGELITTPWGWMGFFRNVDRNESLVLPVLALEVGLAANWTARLGSNARATRTTHDLVRGPNPCGFGFWCTPFPRHNRTTSLAFAHSESVGIGYANAAFTADLAVSAYGRLGINAAATYRF